MKKKFYPGVFSEYVISFFLELPILAIFLGCLYFTILGDFPIFMLLLMSVLLCFAIIMFCWRDLYHVTFYDDKITASRGLDQQKDSLLYEDIASIDLIYTRFLNSQQKSVKEDILLIRKPRFYYQFCLKDNTIKWISISTFNIKQRKAMLDIINEKTNNNFVYENLFIIKR